jgi:hypothetical protein
MLGAKWGAYTGSAANQLGLAARKRRQMAQRSKVSRITSAQTELSASCRATRTHDKQDDEERVRTFIVHCKVSGLLIAGVVTFNLFREIGETQMRFSVHTRVCGHVTTILVPHSLLVVGLRLQLIGGSARR